MIEKRYIFLGGTAKRKKLLKYGTLFLKFVSLFTFVWLATITATNGSPVTISKGQGIIFLAASKCSYYASKEQKTMQQVVELYKSNNFKRSNAVIINSGVADKYYWIHFRLFNADNPERKQIIEVQNPRLNEVELFEANNDRINSLGRYGDFYPFNIREIKYKNLVFVVDLPKGQTKDFFLFVNQIGHTCTIPIVAYNGKHLQANIQNNYLFDGIIYGLLLFVTITSFLFFIGNGRRFYLYYSLYGLTSILWFLAYFGLGFQYLWPSFPKVNASASMFSGSLNIFLNVSICQILLHLKENSKLLYKLSNIARFFLLISAVLPLFIDFNSCSYSFNRLYLIAFLSLMLISVLIVIVSACRYSFKGLLEAKLYMSASFLKVFGIVHLTLVEFGVAPAMFNAEEILQVGLTIEITLLTFALSRRYNSFKFRSYQLVVDAQENERYAISQEIHDGIAGDLIAAKSKLYGLLSNSTELTAKEKQDIEDTIDIIGNAYTDARSISHNIDPEYLNKHSLCESVNKYIELVQSKSEQKNGTKSLKINCVSNDPGKDLSIFYKLNVYRIIQEAITNTIKHSHATRSNLYLFFNQNQAHILVTDDGIGITPSVSNNEISFKNLKSRVKILGGEFNVLPAIPDDFPMISLPYDPRFVVYVRIPLKINIFQKKGLDL